MSRQQNGYDARQALEDAANAKKARAFAFDPKGRPSARPPEDTCEKQAAAAIDRDDPHKVEKLSKLGQSGDDAAEGSE